MDADALLALEASVQRAEGLLRAGESGAALAEYRKILDGRLAAAGAARTLGAADMVVVERLADLSLLFGAYRAADDLLAAMLALCAEAGNFTAADYAALKRADLALARGNPRAARALIVEMKPRIGDIETIALTPAGLAAWERTAPWPAVAEADRVVMLSRLCLIIGRVLSLNGQYGEAEAVLVHGLRHCVAGKPPLAVRARVPVTMALAAAKLEMGAFADAEATLDLIARELDPVSSPGFWVEWMENHSRLAMLAGRLGTALDGFDKVSAFCAERGFVHASIAAELNLAHVEILLNQIGSGTARLDRARAVAVNNGDNAAALRADSLRELARARARSLVDELSIGASVTEMWRDDRAHRPAAKPAGINDPLDLPQASNFLAFFEDRTLAFRWRLARRDMKAAERQLHDIEAVFLHTDSQLIRVRLTVMRAELAYYSDEIEHAARLLGSARDALMAIGARLELWQVIRQQGWCAAKLRRPPDELHRLDEEAKAALDALVSSLRAEHRAIFLLNKWTIEEEFLAGEIDRLAGLSRRLAEGRWWRRPLLWWRRLWHLGRLVEEIERYRVALTRRALGDSGAAANSIPFMSLLNRLRAHRRDQATVAFLVLPDRVVSVVLQRWRLDFSVSPTPRVIVRDLVRQWHQAQADRIGTRELGADTPAPAPGGTRDLGVRKRDLGAPVPIAGPSGDLMAIAARLANELRLEASLLSLRSSVRAIRIMPDDALHGFPFAVVRFRESYLIEHFELSFGAASTTPLGRRRHSSVVSLVGVSQGTRTVPALPAARCEIAELREDLIGRGANVRTLIDTEADRVAVLGALAEAGIFHIACHGQFQPDAPDQSGLVLVPGTEAVDVLSLRDLAHARVGNLEHVTLSSCWGADNYVLPGRWIISLPATLLHAGAGSVLASLWPVDDALAAVFMRQFYRHAGSIGRGEALRRTQIDCLTGRLRPDDAETALPFFWAGFVLHGDRGRLSLRSDA